MYFTKLHVPTEGQRCWAACTGTSQHHQPRGLASEGQGLTSAGLLYAHHVADLQGELGGSAPLEVVYGCQMEERRNLVRPLGTENLCSVLLSLPEFI